MGDGTIVTDSLARVGPIETGAISGEIGGAIEPSLRRGERDQINDGVDPREAKVCD